MAWSRKQTLVHFLGHRHGEVRFDWDISTGAVRFDWINSLTHALTFSDT